MSTHALRFGPLAAILTAAVLLAGGTAASDPLPLPEEYVEIAEPASGIAETSPAVAGEDRNRGPARSTTGGSVEAAASTGESVEAAATVPGAEAKAPPPSRLLRSLEERAAQPGVVSPPPSTDGASADVSGTAAGAPIGGATGSSPVPGSSAVPGSSPVLHGCPRALLGALLASAADADDAVSVLAIESETLALCRERQEIVNGIVALEAELGVLLAEAREEAGAPGMKTDTVGSADAPIVKVSAPVRVIEMPARGTPWYSAPVPAETADTVKPPAPEPPSYSWFSIVGTAGDLRAGVRGGAGSGDSHGGTSVWFVREGDRLPGGVTVMRIVARPPGVHVGGEVEAVLPYRPRSAGMAGPHGDAGGDGS